MSTKTLRKRIALVAVSALTAGLVSVVAAPSANAAAGDTTVNSLQISTTASTTGEGAASQTIASQTTSGWVAKTSTAGSAGGGGFSVASGAAATGIVLPGARIAFSVGGNTTSGTGISVVVTGGSLNSLSQDTPNGSTSNGTLTVSGDSRTAVLVQDGTTAGRLHGRFAVSAAAGSTATIAAYSGTGVDDTTTATAGTLLGIVTLTVAASNASGAYSAAESTIAVQAPYVKGTTASGLLTYDNTSRIANGSVGAIYVNLKDAFTAPITTGTLTATATNGAFVNIVDTIPAAGNDYAATTSFDSEAGLAGGDAYISVTQPVAGAAGSTTVTITLDGAVLATKTLNWNGDIASLALISASSNSIFANGATEDTAAGWSGIVYVAKDAAGNVLTLSTLPTLTEGTGALVGASLGATQNTTSGVLQTASAGYGTATMVVPSSSLQGAGTYKLKLTNSAGTSITTPAINATVSNGSLNSFVASWDKASYAPGEIATLTVTGKDAFGNLIADGTAAAGLSLTVAGSATAGFTAVGTACTASTAFSGGSFTCKYAANTEGAWSFSVDVTTATPQSPSVGALKITAGGATSNADVLKAIVSLIASINKQIAALQKALLRR